MSNQSLYGFLADHCRTADVRTYLEIGTRDGGSLDVVLANAPNLVDVTCCDTWGSEYGGSGRGGHEHIDALLALHGYAGRVRFLDGDSKQTVPTLREQFDLILVDGDHSAEGGMADLKNCWPLVASGGCLAFHDITHPDHLYLADVFDKFAASRGAPHQVILEPHGVGVMWNF
jgi:predicted O-methyltransferase YrrM